MSALTLREIMVGIESRLVAPMTSKWAMVNLVAKQVAAMEALCESHLIPIWPAETSKVPHRLARPMGTPLGTWELPWGRGNHEGNSPRDAGTMRHYVVKHKQIV